MKTPNQALQQTGHANEGFSWRHAATRVSRLLSLVFGEERAVDLKSEIFPEVSGEEEFREVYLSHLRRHSSALIEEIRRLLQRTDISPDVTDCEIQVFPDQYGDGYVSVCMYFNGRNRLVRKNDKSLYCGACVRFADFVRDIPLYAPDSYDFDARDATVRCVIDWFSECWRAAGGESYRYPVVIFGHDDFGYSEPIRLKTAEPGAAADRPRE